MVRCFLFILFAFLTVSLFAQNRNNIWYFGNGAGINFNTSPPSVSGVYNNMHQLEGCATICNNNGNILFYTNGEEVRNRTNQLMPNGTGLLSNFTSTQAALIIPKPCDTSLYYIFTVPGQGMPLGSSMCYSIVDMSLANGNGDIVSKNIPLYNNVTEGQFGTLDANGKDYWVVSHVFGSNAFLSFLVTDTGVNSTPVITFVGTPILPNGYGSPNGHIRISPNGRKLALANPAFLDLFDFDNSTGIVSNHVPLSTGFSSNYGVEFSPDNSKLYASGNYYSNSNFYDIRQFDLLAGSPQAIFDSKTQIIHSDSSSFWALKLAPDNKIYVAKAYSHLIGVINEPNLPGTACNYADDSFTLNIYGECQLGLPNNLNEYSNCGFCPVVSNISSAVSICANQTYQLPSGTIVNMDGIYIDTVKNLQASCDSIIYNINLSIDHVSFVDTDVHICDGAAYLLPSGTMVNATGVYTDTLRNQHSCDSVITTTHLFVAQVSIVNTTAHICPGQVYSLPSGLTVSSAGMYTDTLHNQGLCDSIITTTHLFIDHASFAGMEVDICEGQVYQLPSGTMVNAAGIYSDTLRSLAGCDSVINNVQLHVDHVSFQNMAAQICSNQQYELPSGIMVNNEGIYIDTLRSGVNCDSIINTIYLTVNDLSYTSRVDSIYAGQTFILPSGTVVSAEGTYQSILTNHAGCDSIIITQLKLKKSIAGCLALKNAFTPNGDGVNDYWVLYSFHCFKKIELDIYNRYGSMVYHAGDYKNDWNGLYKNKPLPDGTYYYIMKLSLFDGREETLKGNVTILR